MEIQQNILCKLVQCLSEIFILCREAMIACLIVKNLKHF